MKTHIIKTPTAELLIVEPPISWGLVIGKEVLLIYDNTKKIFGKTYTFNGYYTLLGKPDEISEEDAKELFYNPIDVTNLTHYANLRNLLSLIDSEIYWDVNPLGEEPQDIPDLGEFTVMMRKRHQAWREAEEKTFNRKRTLIFKKN